MKKSILIFPILFLLLPFWGKSEDNENSIESIYVLYYNYSFNSPVDIDCDCLRKRMIGPFIDITDSGLIEYPDSMGIVDTLLTDPKLLREVHDELKKLTPNANPYPPDTRASYTLRYKDGSEEKICMGEYDHFWFKGRSYTNNRLLYLLRKSIDYYRIVWEPMLDGLEELNDTTFEREPVVGKHGMVY